MKKIFSILCMAVLAAVVAGRLVEVQEVAAGKEKRRG